MLLLMFGWMLSAQAQEDENGDVDPAEVEEDDATEKAEERQEGKREKQEKEDRTKWKVRPHVDPTLNLHLFNTEDNLYVGANFGGAVGAKYQQKKKGFRYQGLTRAQYVQTWGQATGQDIRVGSFFGPWWRIVGFQVGPDVFYNTYDNPGVNVDDVVGISTRAAAVVDLKVVNVTASIAPSFYVSGDREGVNWSQEEFPGVGDELTYSVGAGVDLWLIGLGLSYTSHMTSFGNESRIGFGISIF